MDATLTSARGAMADLDAGLLSTFDEQFAAARPRLVSISEGLVGSAAEDVVQEAYIRGRSRFHQLRNRDAFVAWITRITINLCFNHQRRGRWLQSRFSDEDPIDTSSSRDVGLRELIEELPTRERTLIVLHYGHGYTIAEIADVLGIPSGTARSILHRARIKLATQLRAGRT